MARRGKVKDGICHCYKCDTEIDDACKEKYDPKDNFGEVHVCLCEKVYLKISCYKKSQRCFVCTGMSVDSFKSNMGSISWFTGVVAAPVSTASSVVPKKKVYFIAVCLFYYDANLKHYDIRVVVSRILVVQKLRLLMFLVQIKR